MTVFREKRVGLETRVPGPRERWEGNVTVGGSKSRSLQNRWEEGEGEGKDQEGTVQVTPV